ncbi:MAG: acyltransferase family protein [Xanthobacteraceae bacterium]
MASHAIAGNSTDRVDWVDYAKGFCIIMVVMLHSTFGVQEAMGREGFMQALVAFAKPFRMPDFFLISGLFLARVIDRDWRTYLDRKVVHFAFFYALWITIQFVLKAPGFAAEHGWMGVLGLYLLAFVEPFGTLWFIYLLPIFFVVAKLARDLRIPPVVVWLVGAALEIAPIATGSIVIDEFASRFVYFYTGYLAAQQVFAFTKAAQGHVAIGLFGLLVWGVVNGILVFAGYADLPFVSLALGFAGAMAVVTLSALLAKSDLFAPVRYCGRNSIVIYLAFFLPMAATRTILIKSGLIENVGVVALIVTAVALIGALVMWWATRDTRLRFLFKRPAWAHLPPRPVPALQPAE